MGVDANLSDAAVDRLDQLVRQPPAEGSHEERELERLLDEVSAYLQAIGAPDLPPSPPGAAARAAQLVRDAEALRSSVAAERRRASLSSFPEDGEGIGPTTGV